MRAVTIPEFGHSEVLRVEDVPTPEPAVGEVAIDVAFAGVNYAEVLYRRGAVDVSLPYVPGIEVSGHIQAIGEGTTGLRVGQAVAALTIVHGGGYAQAAVTDARLVAPLPEPQSIAQLEVAAALPSSSTSAILIMEEVARLREGETVLVHAAAGGVGSQLGQVARMLGAGQVVGTVGGAAKVDAAIEFGYDEVLVRDSPEAARIMGIEQFDVVVDPVGGPWRRVSLGALAPGGRLIAMGNASSSADVNVGANELWLSGKALMGFNLAGLSASRPGLVGRALRRAAAALADGLLRVDVTRSLPLEEAATAHELIEAGSTIGKLVLRTR